MRNLSAIGTEAVIADKRGKKERKTGRDGPWKCAFVDVRAPKQACETMKPLLIATQFTVRVFGVCHT